MLWSMNGNLERTLRSDVRSGSHGPLNLDQTVHVLHGARRTARCMDLMRYPIMRYPGAKAALAADTGRVSTHSVVALGCGS